MLELENVTKLFSKEKGVYEVTLDVNRGEVIALVGPNGTGKSTLIKMIVGILDLDNGCISMDGIVAGCDEYKGQIGYLPEKIIINGQIRAYDLIRMVSICKYNVFLQEEIEKAIDAYKLRDNIWEKMSNLSLGMQKKIGLIIAFMGNPKVIVLDEPTNGLDTSGIIQLKENIEIATRNGTSVIISSHILDFVGAVCDRCVFLKDTKIAKVIEQGSDLERIYKELYL